MVSFRIVPIRLNMMYVRGNHLCLFVLFVCCKKTRNRNKKPTFQKLATNHTHTHTRNTHRHEHTQKHRNEHSSFVQYLSQSLIKTIWIENSHNLKKERKCRDFSVKEFLIIERPITSSYSYSSILGGSFLSFFQHSFLSSFEYLHIHTHTYIHI